MAHRTTTQLRVFAPADVPDPRPSRAAGPPGPPRIGHGCVAVPRGWLLVLKFGGLCGAILGALKLVEFFAWLTRFCG